LNKNFVNYKIVKLKENLMLKKINFLENSKLLDIKNLNEEDKNIIKLMIKNLNNNKIGKFLKNFIINQLQNLENHYSNQNRYSDEIKCFWKVCKWIGGEKLIDLFTGDNKTEKIKNKCIGTNLNKNFIIPSNDTIKKYNEPTKYGIVFSNNEFQNIIEKIKKFNNDKKITNHSMKWM
jgi:hypothetical protein